MLTVVSWNLNSWQRTRPGAKEETWEFLRDELHADVALVQEACPPPFEHTLIGQLDTGPRMRWGAGIVDLTGVGLREVTQVRQPDRKGHIQLTWTTPGAGAAATVGSGADQLTLVSLYGLFRGGASYATMLHHAADLSGLLDDNQLSSNLLIAGDLNLTTQWTGSDVRYNAVERAVLSTFTAWGLRDLIAESSMVAAPDCGCLDSACRHVQTHWHSRSQRPWQVDHAFASPRVKIDIEVVASARTAGLSDHAPLVMHVA